MNKTVTHFFLPHLLLSRKITRLGRNKICSKTPCWKLIRAIPFRHSWWLLKSFWGSFSRFQYYESTRTCIFYAILFLLRAMIGSEFECYILRRHSVWSRWKEPQGALLIDEKYTKHLVCRTIMKEKRIVEFIGWFTTHNNELSKRIHHLLIFVVHAEDKITRLYLSIHHSANFVSFTFLFCS